MPSQTPQTSERYCVVNAKGGVAKTATAANTAAALHERGHNVLAVDADPQGGLGEITGLTDTYDRDPPTTFDAIVNPRDRDHAGDLVVNREDTFDVLPSNVDMLNLERELTLADFAARLHVDGHNDVAALVEDYTIALDTQQFADGPGHAKHLLSQTLDAVEEHRDYDYVIVDAPPFYGEIFDACVYAAPDLVVPALPEGSSQQALDLLVSQLDALEDLTGIVPQERAAVATRVPAPKTNEARRMLAWLDEIVFEDVPVIEVPERVAVQYASDEGVSVLEYDASDASAAAFREVAAYLDDDVDATRGET
ncbi:ParA family protein [Halobacterium salinarum]|uniref:ParA family protein n=1 Tax=Halobacterium salinarum TaxID=2242 RepID=UPI0025534551|nr:ParA family protein [Halobacterium salinarum]MDL0135108.1 ParA family protein [Halobacterium salinarum]